MVLVVIVVGAVSDIYGRIFLILEYTYCLDRLELYLYIPIVNVI